MPCDLVQQIKNLFSVSTAAERRRGDGGLIRSICQLWRVALRHVAVLLARAALPQRALSRSRCHFVGR